MTQLCGTDQRPEIYANPFLFPPTPACRGYPPQTFSIGYFSRLLVMLHAGTPGTNYTTLAFYPQNSLPYYGILLLIFTFQTWSRSICISLTIAL